MNWWFALSLTLLIVMMVSRIGYVDKIDALHDHIRRLQADRNALSSCLRELYNAMPEDHPRRDYVHHVLREWSR